MGKILSISFNAVAMGAFAFIPAFCLFALAKLLDAYLVSFNLILIAHLVISAWIVAIVVGDFPRVISLNHKKPPEDMLGTGLSILAFCWLFTLRPYVYPELVNMPWPFTGSLYDTLRVSTSGIGSFLAFSSTFVFAFLVIFAVAQSLLGASLMLLIKFNIIDGTIFERPKPAPGASYGELAHDNHKLKAQIEQAADRAYDDAQEVARLTREVNLKVQTEQALRQELVRAETQVSVKERHIKEQLVQIADSTKERDELNERIGYLEATVANLRAHLQNRTPEPSPPKPETARQKPNPAELLDIDKPDTSG